MTNQRQTNKRRYVKDYPGYKIEFDSDHMEKIKNYFVVESVQTQPDCLYGFIDEAGDQHLSPDHHLFAISGCAFVGQLDQQSLNEKWRKLRREVFKVGDDKPYKSKRHLEKVKESGLERICDLIGQEGLKFFSCFITCRAVVDNKSIIVDNLLDGVGQIATELFPTLLERAEWYFDHSEKLLVTYMGASEQIGYPTKSSCGGSFLVRQSSLLPALEVADLVNFVVGDRIRSAVKNRRFRYGVLWDAMFANRAKGRCEEILGIGGPVWVPAGP